MSKKTKEHSTVKQFSLKGHSRPVRMVKYSRDGDMFFTCSSDYSIIAWSNDNGEKLGVMKGPSACKAIALSRNTEFIAGAFLMEGIVIFNATNGKEVYKFKPEDGGKAEYVELSYGDKELLVLNVKDGKSKVTIYDFEALLVKEKKVIKVFNYDGEITQISYGYLNEKLYASTINGLMMIIDYESEQTEKTEKIHPGHQIFSFTFSHDFSMLASCGKDGMWKLLHPETLEVVKMYNKESPWRWASFTPLMELEGSDKYHILIGGGQDAREVTTTKAQEGSFETRLYHIIFEEELAQIKGHFGPVHSIEVSPDGRSFVTTSEDGTVRLQRFPLDYFES